jgi:hypothetical protein
MRPDAQLYLHILAATALFGATITLVAFAVAGRRGARHPLALGSLAVTLGVAVPSWVVMLVFGSWTKSREGWPSNLEWLRLGIGIAVAGIFVLLAIAALSFAWLRRPSTTWLPSAVGALSAGYAIALGVAWWVMTTKVPS